MGGVSKGTQRHTDANADARTHQLGHVEHGGLVLGALGLLVGGLAEQRPELVNVHRLGVGAVLQQVEVAHADLIGDWIAREPRHEHDGSETGGSHGFAGQARTSKGLEEAAGLTD